MNGDTIVSADSRAKPPCRHMQAVSYATKMLQTCSPISQCIQDGQLSKAQQLLESANSQWHPASQSASEIIRCCSLHADMIDAACILFLQHKASPSTLFCVMNASEQVLYKLCWLMSFSSPCLALPRTPSSLKGGATP